MAFSAADKTALTTLADELDVVGTWHDGPRGHVITTIVGKLRGLAEGSVSADSIKPPEPAPAPEEPAPST